MVNSKERDNSLLTYKCRGREKGLWALKNSNMISHCSYAYANFRYFDWFNARLTKLFFVTRLTREGGGVVATLDFPNQTPYEIGFGINR